MMLRTPHHTMHAVTQLWHLMDEVANATSDAQLYDIALRSLQSTLGVQRVGVMLLTSDGKLRSVAHLGLSADYRAQAEALTPPSRAAITSPLLIHDVVENPEMRPHLELLRSAQIGALAVIPMCFGSRVLGRVTLYYSEPHRFEDREIAVARAVASHIAFALEHRRMHQELSEAHDEVAAKLAREREARRRVHESESRLRLALDAGHMGTWEWSVRTGEVIWSPELQIIHGLEPGSFDGTFEAFKQDIHPDDLDRVLDNVRTTLAGDADDYRIEYRLITPAGETRWIEARGRLVRDDDGEPIRLLGICSNITDRKRREELRMFLNEAGDLLATSLEAEETLSNIARIAVPRISDWCTIHLEGDDGDINPVAAAHVDPEMVQLARDAQKRWSVRKSAADGVAMVLRTGQPVLTPEITSKMLRATAQDEEHYALLESLRIRSAMIVPLRSGAVVFGTLTLISSDSGRTYTESDLAFAQQLADRAALAVENSRLYEQATRAAKAREEMIAVVSHDLRNPINTIATACALQDLPIPPEKKARALESIQRAAKTMEGLIQNLLDVARIDSGQLSLEREALDVGEVIEEACSLFIPLAEHASIRLEHHVEAGLPPLQADRDRLLQMLSNLLGNATKFVQAGGFVRVVAEQTDEETITISVADSGIGIQPEQLPHLFTRFWQASRDGRNGTGLGLAIVKGIVDAHQGEITVESSPGEGTVFSVRLPLA